MDIIRYSILFHCRTFEDIYPLIDSRLNQSFQFNSIMKFLPALVLATSSVVVLFVEADICSSVSGICSTDNNGKLLVLNDVTYCVGGNITKDICGVSIDGIADYPELLPLLAFLVL